jgi:serine/threonine-protein kinase
MTPEPGVLVGGKYRLDRPLGAGGMGAVWVARHTQLDVDVAIKLMAPGLASSPSAVARFHREAKAAAQLKTPHVVHIYDFGVEDGSPFIAMELLDGEDLDSLLQRDKRLPLARAAAILAQAAKGLRAAHDAGIVHRDLKPSNLFLADVGGDMVVKILDFGIAKEVAPAPSPRASTTTGVVLGSPLYMSPEQARGGSVGPASDLWSLAVVAFEMVTGTHPFLGNTMGDVIAKICGDELPVPSQLAPGLPRELDAFFARALKRDPARRFASARELSDAFTVVAAARAEDESRPTLPALQEAPSLAERASAPTEPAVPVRGRAEATAPLVIAAEAKPAAPAESNTPAPPPRRRVLLAGAIVATGAALVAAYVAAARPAGDEIAVQTAAAGNTTSSSTPVPPGPSSSTPSSPVSAAETPPPPAQASSAPPPPSAPAPRASARVPPRATAAPRASAAPEKPAAPANGPPPTDATFGLPVNK